MLHLVHNAKVSVNGVESSGKDPKVVASLFDGDVITLYREGKGLLEFFCRFSEGLGAREKDRPVIFRKPTCRITSIEFQ